MVEHYKARKDRLVYKEVAYIKPTKKFEPADKERSKHIQVQLIIIHVLDVSVYHVKLVQSITEKYDRDLSMPANSDVAQKVFLFDEHKIIVTYHLEENRVTRSQREFYLPNLTGEQAQPLTLTPDMTSSYQVINYQLIKQEWSHVRLFNQLQQVDAHAKEPKQRVLFEELEQLVKDQEKSVKDVRSSEKEVYM